MESKRSEGRKMTVGGGPSLSGEIQLSSYLRGDEK
jgi:hypothetical protein